MTFSLDKKIINNQLYKKIAIRNTDLKLSRSRERSKGLAILSWAVRICLYFSLLTTGIFAGALFYIFSEDPESASATAEVQEIECKTNTILPAGMANDPVQNIQYIKELAYSIAETYPVQDLRHMRKFFLTESCGPYDNLQDGFKSKFDELNEKKALIQEAVSGLESLEPTDDMDDELQKDRVFILGAENLLALVLKYGPQGKTTKRVTLPNGDSYLFTYDNERSVFYMFAALLELPKIEKAADSTSKAEAGLKKGGRKVEAIKLVYTGIENKTSLRPWHFYASVYGVKNLTIPGFEKFKKEIDGLPVSKTVANPGRVFISDFALVSDGKAGYTLVPTLGDRFVELSGPNEQSIIFSWLYKYKAGYDSAARLLNSSHPDIPVHTWSTFLQVNTWEELFWMGTEDPWQDRGAASSYDSEFSDAYDEEYEKYKAKGMALGLDLNGKAYDFPWWIGTKFGVSIEKQGIGPNAILIGDFLGTAKFGNQKLWDKYFPGVEPTVDNAVRIALDPVESIKAVALVYDVRLRTLQKTVFSNSSIVMPGDAYPTFNNTSEARRYFILSWLRYIKAFPEVGVNFPEYFPYGHHSWNVEFLASLSKVIEGIQGTPDSFPSLQVKIIGSQGTDYFNTYGPNDPKNTDALKIVVVPK